MLAPPEGLQPPTGNPGSAPAQSLLETSSGDSPSGFPLLKVHSHCGSNSFLDILLHTKQILMGTEPLPS